MKRIEAVVQSEVSRDVVKAVRETGVGGVTLEMKVSIIIKIVHLIDGNKYKRHSVLI